MRLGVAVCVAAMLALPSPGTAQPRAIEEQTFDCLVDAHSRIKVAAAVPGLVEKIHVDRGDRVRAGQPLFELESSVERANLDLARARAANDQQVGASRARLERAARTADRLQRLKQANAGAVTEAQFDEATTEARVAGMLVRDGEMTLEAARLEAERSAALLAQRVVRSAVDGVVVERLMSEGEYRHDQAHVLTLARIDPLHVEVFVPVAFFGQARLGQRAEVRPESPIGGRYTATVIVVDPLIDAASGTFGVRLALPNPDHALPAGLRCRLQFQPRATAPPAGGG